MELDNLPKTPPAHRSRDVLVVLESPAEPAERTEAVNKGLLAAGGRIANLLEGSLFKLIAEPSRHSISAWIQAAGTLLEDSSFRLVLFAHTDKAGELAPRIAQASGAAAVMDCFDIRVRNGNVYCAKFVHGGQYEQEISFTVPTGIAAMKPESLEGWDSIPALSVPVEEIRMRIPKVADPTTTVRTIPPDFKNVEIGYARHILDIGAGCDRPELMELAEELSGLLEASVGTTRLVVDNGSISKSRMIGQTGKSVSPERCMTLGVSGSPHHIAGLGKSGTILSVNSDERAPVFGASDAGFVSDLHALLPKLISRIKQYRDEKLT